MRDLSGAPGRDLIPALRDLARDRPLEVSVRGGCMAPALAEGERVEVVPARRYWPGDVLVFRAADGRLLAHRLLGYRRHAGRLALVTRGDGCPCLDSPVLPERVVGRVRGAVAPAARVRAAAAFLALGLRRVRRILVGRWASASSS